MALLHRQPLVQIRETCIQIIITFLDIPVKSGSDVINSNVTKVVSPPPVYSIGRRSLTSSFVVSFTFTFQNFPRRITD
jgi:hypothetical protein